MALTDEQREALRVSGEAYADQLRADAKARGSDLDIRVVVPGDGSGIAEGVVMIETDKRMHDLAMTLDQMVAMFGPEGSEVLRDAYSQMWTAMKEYGKVHGFFEAEE